MKINKSSKIGELVAYNLNFSSVFKSLGIDFCCKGNRTIQEACDSINIDSNQVILKLNQIKKIDPKIENSFQNWSLDLLADYIEKKHHRFVKLKSKELKLYLNKICDVHGHDHPELFMIENCFLNSVKELEIHMEKEEITLFPIIRNLVVAEINCTTFEETNYISVEDQIQSMMNDHIQEGDRFNDISKYSNGYHPPKDACNTYQLTFSLLKEFEIDLHTHIHLENNILFPKAIKLEKQLRFAKTN